MWIIRILIHYCSYNSRMGKQSGSSSKGWDRAEWRLTADGYGVS